jgi:hypothetical protein
MTRWIHLDSKILRQILCKRDCGAVYMQPLSWYYFNRGDCNEICNLIIPSKPLPTNERRCREKKRELNCRVACEERSAQFWSSQRLKYPFFSISFLLKSYLSKRVHCESEKISLKVNIFIAYSRIIFKLNFISYIAQYGYQVTVGQKESFSMEMKFNLKSVIKIFYMKKTTI